MAGLGEEEAAASADSNPRWVGVRVQRVSSTLEAFLTELLACPARSAWVWACPTVREKQARLWDRGGVGADIVEGGQEGTKCWELVWGGLRQGARKEAA